MKGNGKKRQAVDEARSPYPFPFPKDILQHFAKPGEKPVWEDFADEWTPEWDVPLCLKCLIEWEKLARVFSITGLKRAYREIRDETEFRDFIGNLIKVHEQLFDKLVEIITLDRKTFAIDPVTHREVLNPNPLAPRLLPQKPEKLPQYPFSVPRGVIHMADERIIKPKPSSEHYQDLTTYIALTDNLLDTLLHIINEAHETFAYDPVVQRQVRHAAATQPTA